MNNKRYRATRRLPLIWKLLRALAVILIAILIIGLGYSGYTHYQHGRIKTQLQLILKNVPVGKHVSTVVSGWSTNPAVIRENFQVHETIEALSSQFVARLKANGYVIQPGGPVAVTAYNTSKKTNITILEQDNFMGQNMITPNDSATSFSITVTYGQALPNVIPVRSKG